MITKNCRVTTGYRKDVARLDQKINAKKAELQQEIEKLTAEKQEYEGYINELTQYEDIVSSMFDDCGNATLVTADIVARLDKLLARLDDVDSGFLENAARKIGATLEDNPDGTTEGTGTYNGCTVTVQYIPKYNDILVDIHSVSSLLTTSTTDETDVMEALDRADELDEGTFSRVINKIRRATLDEHDPNNRKLYNFIDRFKKEFGIKAETKNAGYGYLRDGDNEVRNYRMYLNCDSEVTKQFFIDGKAYKGLKPEYASRFTMNGASNYKPNDAMSDGEIQVEISLDTIYFDLHVVMNAAKAEKNRETYNKRFAKAYELDDDM